MMIIMMMFIALMMVGVMMILYFLVRASSFVVISSSAGIESGLSVTGKSHANFSLQYFSLMLLLLIFDLEVIFIISLINIGFISIFASLFLLFFIGGTLWMEWIWGKLVWTS